MSRRVPTGTEGLAIVALMLFACTPRASEGTPTPADNGAGEASADAADAATEIPEPPTQAEPVPTDPSYALMQTVCASPCTGAFARVQVYRDARAQIARLRFDGDRDNCSHPPSLYFDAQGQQTLAVPNEAVVPGSPEAEAFAATQAAQIEGLVLAETLSCFGASMCEADKIPANMRSSFACRSDSDCVECACDPVNRDEWTRRGGASACNIDGEECIATNPACCDGHCVLTR